MFADSYIASVLTDTVLALVISKNTFIFELIYLIQSAIQTCW